MRAEIKAEYYDRLFKIIVPIIIAVSAWYIRGQAEEIGSLASAVNESVIQQRELFIKIENFEKHLMRSDQSIQSLERRMNAIELRLERFDEKFERDQK